MRIPDKLPIPPYPVEAGEVIFVEGWNACVDEFLKRNGAYEEDEDDDE